MIRSVPAILALFLAAVPLAAQTGSRAEVTIRLPREARLFVDDVATPLTGEVRAFNTPPLTPGQRFKYKLRVEIDHEGRKVRVTREVSIRAGERIAISFGDRQALLAAAAAAGKTAETGRPLSQQPYLTLVTLRDGAIVWKRVVSEYHHEARTRLVPGRDGKLVPQTYTVAVPVYKEVEARIPDAGKARVFGTDGKEIDAGQLPQLLREPRMVLISDSTEPDPFYLQFIKEGTLILVPPLQAPPPAVPVETPKPLPLPRPGA